ncbi:MAG: VWA domain-containing protein [Clostridia bacterium]|nr:VWA domain-containing protein [Clostridia bacterium]
MRNISFDNPWLLLLAIPLLAAVIVPYCIAIRKDNKNAHTVTSLILHLLIIALVVPALAGMASVTVMTQTEVYVVADVSYSANRNLDLIDSYITELQTKLPENSIAGLVCFGKDAVCVTPAGEEVLPSVTTAQVDDSATDIAAALEYTATLFSDGVIKRVVLLTDGKQTDDHAAGELISAVEHLYAENIALDTIYVDNNVNENVTEVQISDVDHTPSTYLDHRTTANVLIQSSAKADAIVSLYRGSEKLLDKAVSLDAGYQTVSFETDTSAAGEFDYEVRVSAPGDVSPYNNSYYFTQRVTESLHVLFITSSQADADAAAVMYGENATIHAYVNDPNVPCTIEQLCAYDQIVLSNVDVRGLKNYTAFVDSVDKAVSLFGKSLITLGDTYIQNKTDDTLSALEDMLPVRFGNDDADPKLYCLVLDSSRSMQMASRLIMTKKAAVKFLELLGPEDYVMVVSFSGEVYVEQMPTEAKNKEQVAQIINGIQPTQGTVIGAALKAAFNQMKSLSFSEKQVVLISDGMSYSAEPDDAADMANQIYQAGIITTVINTSCQEGTANMEKIASYGRGRYYWLEDERDLDELIFGDVADEVTETVIEKQVPVTVVDSKDDAVKGLYNLPDVYGYVYSKAKASAKTVLSVPYTKASGSVVDAPLYAYWKYGNGRVACYTSTVSGEWAKDWQGEDGMRFFNAVAFTNTPTERIDYPYTLGVTYDGTQATLEMIPATLNPYATVSMRITLPDGSVLDVQPVFDSRCYSHAFPTSQIGKYKAEIVYEYGENTFTSQSVFNISYSPEYDSFVTFDPAELHNAVRDRGTLSEGTVPELVNDPDRLDTYSVYFTVPLLIAAAVLYVIDIIVRKITKNDIKSLFRFKKKA